MEKIMSEPIINEKVKSYLIACLVTGIDVESKPDALMTELVDHMNSAERHFWADGDEDGVIVHNKHDVPIMYIMYNGKRMTFRAFEEDDYTAMINRSDMGYALLNIMGLLQMNGLLKNLIIPYLPHLLKREFEFFLRFLMLCDWLADLHQSI